MIVSSYTVFRAVFGAGEAPDASGYERWPVEKVLGPGGEPGFQLVMPASLDVVAVLSVNGQAYDAVPGVDEFDWYFSQRTEVQAAQIFAVERMDDAGGTRSGTVRISPTWLMTALYSLDEGNPTPTIDQAERIYKYVTVYVRRRSNGAIMQLRWP